MLEHGHAQLSEPTRRLLRDEQAFRFHMGLRPGDAVGFFQPSPSGTMLLGERRRWLNETPGRYASALPGAEPVLAEFGRAASGWLGDPALAISGSADAQILAFGRHLEPDLLFLLPSEDGLWRLCAGAVCFPSSWALEEKMGRPLSAIHEPVPGLNTALDRHIATFLGRLEPKAAWERSNWGLSADNELNRHPARGLGRLESTASLDSVWLRVEHQLLLRLSATGGLVFGIRLEIVPLSGLMGDTGARVALASALDSMPEPVADYKGVSRIRKRLSMELRGA